MRKRRIALAIFALAAVRAGASARSEGADLRPPIPAGTLGAFSPEVGFPVENSLGLVLSGDRPMIAGETDTTARYQIQSREIRLKSATTMLAVHLAGDILSGKMYVGVLDDHSSFLAPTRVLESGPIRNLEIFVPSGGTRTASIVLGNAQPGQKSEWQLWEIGLDQSGGIPLRDLKKLRFFGSAWAWAYEVLTGKWDPRADSIPSP